MKQKRLHCPYCGAVVIKRPSGFVYGSKAVDKTRYVYVCSRWPRCNTYVNAHKKTGAPMGTLANSELRHLRIQTHHAIQKLQRKWNCSDVDSVYRWLQAKTGLSHEDFHIGQFSEYRCRQVIQLCRHALLSSMPKREVPYEKQRPTDR